MVVTSAVVGAGVVAFAAGSALPQQGTEGATAALDRTSTTSKDKAEDGAADQLRTASVGVGRAARSQTRAGTPAPQIMPEWVRPAKGPLSSLYGARWGTTHRGLDIAAPYGATVVAASAGKIKFAGYNGGYGMLVIVDHGKGITTRYAHNSKILVDVGDKVEAGTAISEVGSTGYSTGAHLHFEVRDGEESINPLPFMRARGVAMDNSVDTNR